MGEGTIQPRVPLDEKWGATMVETTNLIIRRWRMLDAKAFAAAANHEDLAAVMQSSYPQPFTVADARIYLLNRAPELTSGISTLAITAKAKSAYHNNRWRSKVLGEIHFQAQGFAYYRTWEMTWWINPDAWSSFLELEMLDSVVPWVFDTWPDLNRLEVSVHSDDTQKVEAMLFTGFTIESRRVGALEKRGKMVDEIIMRYMRADYDARLVGKRAVAATVTGTGPTSTPTSSTSGYSSTP